jgi:predicted TIM-barrel fold metal-dependent hydrolase
MSRRDREEALSEAMPVDVYPCSNGEFLPEAPTAEQRRIMAIAEAQGEIARRKLGMSRRDFVRTAAAMGIGVWAIGLVTGKGFGNYALANPPGTAGCDLEFPDAQLNNLPGEFIFDIQSHHIDPHGEWRINNPGFHAVFAAIWEQSGPLGGYPGRYPDGDIRGWGRGGELDPIDNLSRFHYLKELYLDSATTMTVLSAVPSAPEQQPLPLKDAAETIDVVNSLASGAPRAVMHAFVMPNRGSAGTTSTVAGRDPLYMASEFEAMERHVLTYRDKLVGWKVYTPWGDIPNASGWYLDDAIGFKFLEQVRRLGNLHGVNKVVAAHKGFALPAFDQRAASARDVGPAAKTFTDIKFVVYHSGYDGEKQAAYPGDDKVNSADRSVNSFIKGLRENLYDATRFVPTGLHHGNVPNVYAEIGSTMAATMRNADEAAHLLGKLITFVGPRRICWGTDSLWFGSPQPIIVALRALNFSQQARDFYNLPYGLDGDRWDPNRNALDASSYLSPHAVVGGWPTDGLSHPERTIRNGIFGRNAAEAYGVDPDGARAAISCDNVQKLKEGYLIDVNTPRERAPARSNQLFGFRTPAALVKDRASRPWSP